MQHTVRNKIRPAWRYLLRLLLLLVLLFFLLGFVADAWLESAGGRQVLQRELRKRLGLPVALKGDYGLRFLPRLKIAGSGLEVGLQGGEGVLTYSRNFSVEVELLPLIRQELRIVAISLSDGFIDLARLSGPGVDTGMEAGSRPESPISLPDLATLNLSNFSIRYDDSSDRIDLSELRLTGFKAGVPSGLEINARAFRGENIWAAAIMRGKLTVETANLSSELEISELQISLGETVVDGLTGEWQWTRSAAALEGRLNWEEALRSTSVHLELALDAPVSGSLRGRYLDPALAGPLTLEAQFALLPDAVELEQVRIGLGEQNIAGRGCLRFADKSGLHLTLHAGELDLDELNPVLSMGDGGEEDLPLDLAIRMRVKTALMAGAVADDVLVEIGAEPDCGAAGNSRP